MVKKTAAAKGLNLDSPFTWVNSISQTKQDLMVDDIAEKAYNAFMVNRALSQYQDTVLFANEMNRLHHLDSRLQYDFFLNGIRKSKRFAKWPKKDREHHDFQIVKEYFGYSNEKARGALKVLLEDDIKEIRRRMNKGGKKG